MERDRTMARPSALTLDAELVRAQVVRQLFGVDPEPVELGPYRVLQRVGAGSSGWVFEACDPRNGQRLALKLLRTAGDDALRRLKREFRALADLHHRNLVQLYELAVVDGLPVLAMELVEGTSLEAYARPSGTLQPSRLSSVFEQLVDAVSVLHRAGVIHRDLKPSNLLVQADGRLVVLDFGLALGTDDQQPSSRSGTLRYMAPERVAGQPASEASDWYSVGMILLEALCGAAASLADLPPPDPTLGELGLLCEQLLRPDPAARPRGPELRARLRLGSTPAASSPLRVAGAHAPFLGRERELAVLQRALTQAREGRSVVVFLHGEPGIGKTALLRRAAQAFEAERGLLLLPSRCYEGERIAYNAADGVVDALAHRLGELPQSTRDQLLPAEGTAELLRLFPMLRRVLSGQAAPAPLEPAEAADLHRVRQRAFAALRALLHAFARIAPVVIQLDDLQWGDADSARLLRELLQPPAPAPLLLIASYRSADAQRSPCVQALQQLRSGDAADSIELRLGPLEEHAAFELARHLCEGRLNVTELEALSREAGGSPLFVRALVEQQAQLGVDSGTTHSLHALLLNAFVQLPDAERELLELAALCGRPIARELLLSAAQRSGRKAAWAEHLATLQRSGLLRSVPGRDTALESYHDRVRESVVAVLPAERQHTHHAQLAAAAALQSHDANAEFIAHHCECAGQLGEAARFAELAADRAFASVALEQAAKLYAQALRCHGDRRPGGVLLKLANATAYTGRCAEASPLYLEAAAEHEPTEALALRLRAAEMLLRAGKFEQAAAVTKPVLRAVGIRYPATSFGARAVALINMQRLRLQKLNAAAPRRAPSPIERLRGDVCFSLGYRLSIADPARACALLIKAVVLATQSGTDAQLARALAAYVWILAALDRAPREEQERLMEQALELASRTRDAETMGWVLLYRCMTFFTRTQFQLALDAVAEAEPWIASRCVDAGWLLQELAMGTTGQQALLGKLRDLGESSRHAISRAREVGNAYHQAGLSLQRCFYLLGSGGSREVLELTNGIIGAWAPHDYLTVVAAGLKMYALLYEDDVAAAWQCVQRHWPHFARAGYEHVMPWKVILDLIKATVAIGCAGQGLQGPYVRTVKHVIARLAPQRAEFAPPGRLLLQAGLARLEGEQGQASALYARAAEAFEAVSMLGYAAAARVRQAELSDATAAAAARARADAWFEAEGVVDREKWVRTFAPAVRPRA